MNSPDLFDDDVIPDDDYIGTDNDEEEELGIDYMSMEDTPDLEDNQAREPQREENRPSLRPKHRAKIKPMPPSLLRKMPDVASMLITKTNGKQVLLVNPKVYR
jgi:hypothetical protein